MAITPDGHLLGRCGKGAKFKAFQGAPEDIVKLDKLHEHIQTAMGWTNSHLHHFKIGEQLYGDPMLMQENMDEMDT